MFAFREGTGRVVESVNFDVSILIQGKSRFNSSRFALCFMLFRICRNMDKSDWIQ